MPIEQNLETSGSLNSTSGVTSAVPLMPFSRGSEWRKWDLPVHTPASGMANGYGGDWDDYVKTLFTLAVEREVAAIGITDYFTIEGYEKIVNEYMGDDAKLLELFESEEMVAKVKAILLLPNIELRIDTLVNSRRVNYHVIFSNEVTIQDIKENFLSEIEFVREASPFTRDNSYKLSRHNLEELGLKIRSEQDSFTGDDFEVGCKTAVVSASQIRDILDRHKNIFAGKYLIGIPVDEDLSDISWGSQEHLVRKILYQQSSFFFTSNKNTRDFALGLKHPTKEEYIREFKTFKPCLIGCDAHSKVDLTNKLGLYSESHECKITWIKADPTFDGLRQILFEPSERVKIQEPKPEEKPPYQVIDSIVVSEDGFWKQEIQLNSNLVTIIGGRSSGKSTLLSCMATKIGYSQEYDDPVYSDEEKRFIQNHQDSLTVKWADNGDMQDHQVDFFRQNYMIHLQSDRKEIDKLIAKILRATPENASRFSKYEQFLIDTKADITKDCALLFSQREKIAALDLEIKEKGGLDGHAKEVRALAKQLDEKKKQHSNLTAEEQLVFDRIKNEVEQHKEALATIRRDKSAIDALIEEEEATVVPTLDDTMFSEEFGTLLVGKHASIWAEFHNKWLSYLKDARDKIVSSDNEITAKIQNLISDIAYKRGVEELSANSILKDLEQQLANEKLKYSVVFTLVQQRKKLQDENHQLIRGLSEKHCSFKERAARFVSTITWSNEDIAIKGIVRVKTSSLKERLEGQITRKSKAQQDYFVSLINHDAFDLAKVVEFLNDVMARRISYNQDVDEQYLVSEFLSSNWFEINYDIVYQGDTFSAMSPGKRAFVILRLLLEFGNNECPILIDQPEDSLDNRAIFTELVQYLRDKKKKRQIILVTHNPNVVVGADAEQVIVANQTGSKNENVNRLKFSYASGALENSRPKDITCATILESQGIREHVCEILEGGEDAFKKRESKYGFSY